MRIGSGLVLLLLVSLGSSPASAADGDPELRALSHMSLEELADLDVTSVSRVPQRLTESASAAYVITREEIRRSGARSIPEALRLAPGVQVARVGAFGRSVSIRGFNGDLSNKLLVLMDGRSVYSPLFAGVFWDVQDYLMEDIERIEVVAGPGGALWGANAVNGVISIITRSAQNTQGTFVQAGAGRTDPVLAGARVGGKLTERFDARVYAKYSERDDVRALNSTHTDDGKLLQAGFRVTARSHPAHSPGKVTSIGGTVCRSSIGTSRWEHARPVPRSSAPTFEAPTRSFAGKPLPGARSSMWITLSATSRTPTTNAARPQISIYSSGDNSARGTTSSGELASGRAATTSTIPRSPRSCRMLVPTGRSAPSCRTGSRSHLQDCS